MKKVSVVIFDRDSDSVIADENFKLPSKEASDDANTFDIALEVLNSIGMECCMMTRLYTSSEIDIWQALHYADLLEFEGTDKSYQWISKCFIDCETSGNWTTKLVGNLPRDNSVNSFIEKKED